MNPLLEVAERRYWHVRNLSSCYRRSWADWFVELVASRARATLPARLGTGSGEGL
jgi:hypothetical protein